VPARAAGDRRRLGSVASDRRDHRHDSGGTARLITGPFETVYAALADADRHLVVIVSNADEQRSTDAANTTSEICYARQQLNAQSTHQPTLPVAGGKP